MTEIIGADGVPRTFLRHSWSKILDTMLGSGVADADLMARASGLWARKPIGSEGDLFKVVAGVPTWTAAPGGGGGVGLYAQARQATLLLINNATTGTTYVDTDLAVALDPGTYRFEVKNFCTSHATPDMKQRLHFTGTVDETNYLASLIIWGNTSYFNAFESATDVGANYTTTTNNTTTYRGTIKVSTSGTFSYQAAQNTASAHNIQAAHIGGYMNIWQLG